MFIAQMESENYSWIAIGETEKEAKEAIVNKWNDSTREPMTVEKLDEYYGIATMSLKKGECVVW